MTSTHSIQFKSPFFSIKVISYYLIFSRIYFWLILTREKTKFFCDLQRQFSLGSKEKVKANYFLIVDGFSPPNVSVPGISASVTGLINFCADDSWGDGFTIQLKALTAAINKAI